ncbi:MAG TPA: DUF1801 domain-containing protein [Actinophytocola sp.]|uniref:DUF1801 domain-containing protein n=1 Tax=Actinophytocola sp. TaxID=1872138 RepID=UPI002DDCE698|nr:DUF1801 domain-containing protein [Actinophytocola sp.]HEV2784419.1 DUF1801 domain-containing protein [Actinophytocola sp.]
MSTSTIRAWFDDLDARHRAHAEELATLVTTAEPRLERAVKWGRLTFTLDGNWHHWLYQIAAPAKGAKLIFHKGALLDDPEGLLTGSARYLREIPAQEALNHPDAVRSLIHSAIAHPTDMLG